jgi:hypothetical protein
MGVPLIEPSQLSPQQQGLYQDMKAGIGQKFNDFLAVREDGALMGPWNPWLHSPRIGKAIWDLTKTMSMEATLPDDVRQVAILVTGAHFNAAYEIYAHVAQAERDSLPAPLLASLVAGVKPNGLSADQEVAYAVSHQLLSGGVLPRPTYDAAVKAFGQDGANELIYLGGLYCMVSLTLNGFNVPVPELE